jgi:acetoin utilization protein AcuB
MTKNPATVHPSATLRQALEIMESVGCRHLPVISDRAHLIGILSDRDCRLALNSPNILRERWQDEMVINQTTVAAMMTPAPIVIEQSSSASEAARLMLNNHISALPVMRDETLVGIVTSSDLLVAFMRQEERLQGAGGEKTKVDNWLHA